MKLTGTVSIPFSTHPLGRSHVGNISLDIPSVHDGKPSDGYVAYAGVTDYANNTDTIVRAFNKACEAFQNAFEGAIYE